jgi:glutamate racemase
MSLAPSILIFDSGLGGLTVAREVMAARADAPTVYLADDAIFPYGDMPEAQLIERVVTVVGEAIAAHQPGLVVIACNTASTLALAELRRRFAVPFVGTVPAIKPACAQSATKRVAVLGTQATVSREYTRALIREFAQGCDVDLVGSSRLAAFAEAELNGIPVADDDILREIAPCFVERDGRRTDIVVLACTHYPLLAARLAKIQPWPVNWLDPAPAIARRVVGLIGPANEEPRGDATIAFTSGRAPGAALAKALSQFGFPVPAATMPI